MALSNWDTLAFGPDGKADSGVFEARKWLLEIYKNWAYVRTHEETPGSPFANKVIAQVNEGDLHIGPFKIYAKRGPQRAIFLVAENHEWDAVKKKSNYRYFAGIGCYGFKDIHENLRDAGYRGFLSKDDMWYSSTDYGENDEEIHYYGKMGSDIKVIYARTKEEYYKHFEQMWVGVRQDTYKEFMGWLEDLKLGNDFEKWLKKVSKASPKRFNQGDMFFAKKVGAPLNATKPGKQKLTTMSKLLRTTRS